MVRYGCILYGKDCSGHIDRVLTELDTRGNYEVPKGGAELSPRVDNEWQCLRREVWEAAGVWSNWRAEGSYHWVNERGFDMPAPLFGRDNAYLVTEISASDFEDPSCTTRRWLSEREAQELAFARSGEVDHGMTDYQMVAWLANKAVSPRARAQVYDDQSALREAAVHPSTVIAADAGQ